MTTAARSRDWLRKQGYVAEVVEHRYGKWRKDLLDIGDTLALPPLPHDGPVGILLVQAHLDSKRNREKHAHLNAAHPMVLHWKAVGGLFHHHRWKKVSGRWTVQVVEI